MKIFIVCLPLAISLTIVFSLSFAQQNQNSQKSIQEIETFKIQLQTVENEKIELTTKLRDAEAKLAEANAKLINAEFGKLERELRDSNDAWLRTWSTWFIAIIAIVVTILCAIGAGAWSRFKSKADQLIADEVEKNLDGFKEAMAQVDTLQNQLAKASYQVNTLQNQIRILEEEHAASVLENFVHSYIGDVDSHPEQIRSLREEILLQLFIDETRWLAIRDKAVEVLAARKSTRLVSPVLKCLNSVVNSDLDSDIDWETIIDIRRYLSRFVKFVGMTYTDEAHQGLTEFLNRLLTENPKNKDLLLIDTVLSLARVSAELNMRDSVSILKSTMSHFESPAQSDLKALAVYFDRLNEPAGIKRILSEHLTSGMPDAENTCLELLQNYDPDFVRDWKVQKETTNIQNEESE